jgi:hypothetical protein
MSRGKTPAHKKTPKKLKKKSIVPRKPGGKIDWAKYNKALGERGNITFWIETEIVSGLVDEPEVKTRGGQRVYCDAAIACVLTVRSVFHLALRPVEKFCHSVMSAMRLDLPTPNYTTLSRRCGDLIIPSVRSLPKSALNIVVDSTGIKVCGEGEWKVRQHGWSQRRTWLKLHLAVDADTQEVCTTVVSAAMARMTRWVSAKRLKRVAQHRTYRRDVMCSFRRKQHRRLIANAPLINVMSPSGGSKSCAAHRPAATYPRPENCGNMKPIIIADRWQKQPCIATKPSSAGLFVRVASTIRPKINFEHLNRDRGNFAVPPPTPSDMRIRIRRFDRLIPRVVGWAFALGDAVWISLLLQPPSLHTRLQAAVHARHT